MANGTTPEENGERATVALVNAKVATVDAKLDGLVDAVKTGFADLKPIPVQVRGLEDRQLFLEARITKVEDAKPNERLSALEAAQRTGAAERLSIASRALTWRQGFAFAGASSVVSIGTAYLLHVLLG